MNINGHLTGINIINKPVSKRNIAFGATVSEIKTGSKEALEAKQICPGKNAFITSIANFFEGLKDKLPKNFEFKLGEKNNFPEAISNIKGKLETRMMQKEMTVGQLDDYLNESSFKCSPTSTCSCGKGSSAGGYLADLFADKMNLNNPDKIEVNKE